MHTVLSCYTTFRENGKMHQFFFKKINHEIFSVSNVHCVNAYGSKADIFQLLCISKANLACCVFWPANACLRMCLLVRDWEWLLKAGWYQKAGCSFKILLFSYFFLHAQCIWMYKYTNKLFFCFSLFFFVSLTWAFHEHDEKGTFLLIFECFQSFSTMQTHAQACLCWSKYTTLSVHSYHLDWQCRQWLPFGFLYQSTSIMYPGITIATILKKI